MRVQSLWRGLHEHKAENSTAAELRNCGTEELRRRNSNITQKYTVYGFIYILYFIEVNKIVKIIAVLRARRWWMFVEGFHVLYH